MQIVSIGEKYQFVICWICPKSGKRLTHLALQTQMATFANSVDTDETACNDPTHQGPHCLPFRYCFLTAILIYNNGIVQILRRKSQYSET